MLFKFLKYLSPINYFNLARKDYSTIFPDWKTVPDSIGAVVDLDDRYMTEDAKYLDASWQLIQKGYIGNAKTITFDTQVSLFDEYLFARKYYNKIWVYFTLVMRILSFSNPFKELKAFILTRKVNRINVYANPIVTNEWDDYRSELVEKQPKVSVVIPTLNRYEYLKDVLEDLEKQDYANFDVIVVDQSEPFNKAFYDQFKLDLILIHQEEKALWLARNTAVKVSDAAFILLFDDDSRVESDWIKNHLKCLDYFDAPISSGTSISLIGAKVPESYSYFKLSDQIDTGNVMLKKDVFRVVGLFDRQFEKQRMGDGEFGLRAYLAGFLNISNPYAQRLHLKVGTGGLRQMGSWDGLRPTNWFAPRPIPSVLYYFRKYYGPTLTKFYLVRTIPPSLMPYKYKGKSKIMFLGYFIVILLFPFVLFQVFKSWKLASKKLRQGAYIEKLV